MWMVTLELEITSAHERSVEAVKCASSFASEFVACLYHTMLTTLLEASLTSRHINDVRLYFPSVDRELWTHSAFLKAASPYFGVLLTSTFAEGSKTTTPAKTKKSTGGRITNAGLFADSDDETDTLEVEVRSPDSDSKPQSDILSVGFHQVVIDNTSFTTYKAVIV